MKPSTENNAVTVPAFLSKLWNMVNDPDSDHLICWNASGTGFIIQNEPEFTFKLLPAYYKHNNMSSFIRQLNMYDFHKVSMLNDGSPVNVDEMQFIHPHFRKNKPSELVHIKRKIPSMKVLQVTDVKSVTTDKIMDLLSNVKNLYKKQTNITNQIEALKQENGVLWREIVILRQRHLKQQQIVNKLIQFLVTFVQSSKRVGAFTFKRSYPLMIEEKQAKKAKLDKISPTIEEINSAGVTVDDLLKESASTSLIEDTSFVEELLQEGICNSKPEEEAEEKTEDVLKFPNLETTATEETTVVEETSNIPTTDEQNVLAELTLGNYNLDVPLEKQQSLVPSKQLITEDLNAHISDTNNHINQFKDLLNNSFVDSDLLLSLFNNESPEYSLPFTEPNSSDPFVSGLEIATYDDDTTNLDLFNENLDFLELAEKEIKD